ncbi:DUF6457 domain-containing protein [Georgenia sp. TF02-10]|uniref:DUF6457 domain-containing protein n=1 Tax=Georgenia sp. TF02-10 TaxID=2917725 RepID=UPI001FA6CEB8|nr:DUF6457 domain-containing protein [Georgenia sp. TF02-10]UNX54004.1 DUF6457 domain-containing protein [Georgenia sp. TF02-10]
MTERDRGDVTERDRGDVTERDRGDETQKMAVMNRWLDAVCAELGVDRTVLDDNTTALLRLINHVAHGPSRPGAPVTAFLVGLAAAAAAPADPGEQSRAVADRLAAVEKLVAAWDEGRGR